MISDARDSVLDTFLGLANNSMPAMPACPLRFIILSSHTLRRCITSSEAHAEAHATACGGACWASSDHTPFVAALLHQRRMRRRMLWHPLITCPSSLHYFIITSSEAHAVRTSRKRGACLAQVSSLPRDLRRSPQLFLETCAGLLSTQHAPTDADTKATP
jgi:hypothetical protein